MGKVDNQVGFYARMGLRMHPFSAIFMLLVLSGPPQPPPPNPDNPVDYIEWINAQFDLGSKQNAADTYLKAVKLFDDDDELYERAKELAGSKLSETDRRELHEWTERNKDCLATFIAASKIRKCYFELRGSGALVEADQRWLMLLRRVAVLLGARARLRLATGDVAGATDDACAILRTGTHVRRQPSMIDHLVGLAITSVGYSLFLDMPLYRSNKTDYPAVIKALRRADRPICSPGYTLLYEKTLVYDMIQRGFGGRDDQGRFTELSVPAETPGEVITARLRTPMTLRQLIDQADRCLAGCPEFFNASYAESLSLGEQLASRIKREVPVGVLVPDYRSTNRLDRRLRAERNAVRIVLRMNAIKVETGRWPTDLKAATPHELIYRHDPFSGRDMVYRLRDGQPLLYSVGTDTKDDGGEKRAHSIGDEGDFVFWPREKE